MYQWIPWELVADLKRSTEELVADLKRSSEPTLGTNAPVDTLEQTDRKKA